ncbi:unnamed protein product [Linum tenue]|uniref:Uncharacterized protein n=1 Tax=Linum tenue TaxID=586396 RepID=A0AAV0HHA7_9ROSI|nr:unnamed protein product [Linum tenue]
MELVGKSGGEESTRELLEAQIQVWHHAYNFVTSMAVKAAVELGLPDAVQAHGGPISLPELTSALGIPQPKAQHFHRLLRVIVNSGYLSLHKPPRAHANDHHQEVSRYSLTTAGRLLTRDNPYKAGAYLRMVMAPLLMDPYQSMATWLKSDREGTTPFSEAHGGKEAWEFMAAEPEFAGLFNEAMGGDSRLIAELVVKDGRNAFQGVRSLVDVGGGTGYLAKAIAAAFPHVDCTVLDLPHVVSGLEGGGGNLKYVAGDMFVHVPEADAVILKWVLHDWSDEECVRILEKAKAAVSSKGRLGKVMVIEMVVGNQSLDEKSVGVQYGFDMGMMISVTGKERDEEELAKLFFQAGFTSYHINPILGTRALIEVYP